MANSKIYLVTGRNPHSVKPSKRIYWNDAAVIVIAPTEAKAAKTFRGLLKCSPRHPVKVKPIGQFIYWDAANDGPAGNSGMYYAGDDGLKVGSGKVGSSD